MKLSTAANQVAENSPRIAWIDVAKILGMLAILVGHPKQYILIISLQDIF